MMATTAQTQNVVIRESTDTNGAAWQQLGRQLGTGDINGEAPGDSSGEFRVAECRRQHCRHWRAQVTMATKVQTQEAWSHADLPIQCRDHGMGTNWAARKPET